MARTGMGFGRLKAPFDGRDTRFLMRNQMPLIRQMVPIKPRKRKYNEGPLLDQGSTPQCVGYAGRGFLNAAPIMTKAEKSAQPGRDAEAVRLYKGSQELDEWPGNNYDGTSVRGLMKYLASSGEVESYVWGQTVQEATEWMNGGFGTSIIGTNWYPEMDNVSMNGVIQEPSTMSSPIGGHAYRVNWFDLKLKLYLIINSWGEYWGKPKAGGSYTGWAYMTPALLERLLREDGEIAAPTQVRLKAVRF